ncbi:MAG: glycosyltransferase family 4 protein [archaeon]
MTKDEDGYNRVCPTNGGIMKVLFVSEYYPPLAKGGGEHSCKLLAKALQEEGVDVVVLTSRGKGLPSSSEEDGVLVLRQLSTGKNPGSFFSNIHREMLFGPMAKKTIRNVVAKHRPDVVHYFNTTSILGRPDLDIPQVMHVNSPVLFCPKGTLMFEDRHACHECCTYQVFSDCFGLSTEVGKMRIAPWMRNNPLLKRWLHRSFRRRIAIAHTFDLYMATSGFMRGRLHKEGIAKGKTIIIPNIIETGRFDTAKAHRGSRNSSQISSLHKTHRFLYLGLLSRNKGVMVLLESLRRLPKEIGNQYHCSIYGAGPIKEEAAAFIRQHKLHATMHAAVPKDRVPALMASHDTVVFPSLIPEGFGRVPIEAMAAGCAVIASDAGALPELVRDGKDGLVVRSGAPEDLKTALRRLIIDKKLHAHLVAGGKKQAHAYRAGPIAREVREAYQALV